MRRIDRSQERNVLPPVGEDLNYYKVLSCELHQTTELDQSNDFT
jgi:hypothetical protein